MENPILNPESNEYEKMGAYSSKLVELYKKILPLSRCTKNSNLPKAISDSLDRAQNSIFINSKSNDEIIEKRKALLSKENYELNDILSIGNLSLYLYDFFASSIHYTPCLPQIKYLNQGQLYLICVTLMHFQSFQTPISILSQISDHLIPPFNYDAYYRCGIMHMKLLNYDAALAEFNKITPNNSIPWVFPSDILLIKSQVFFLKNNISKAISTIEECSNHIPPGVLQHRCFLYLISNNPAKIEKGLFLLFNHPASNFHPDLLYLHGRLLYKQGRIKEAFGKLHSAIKLKDDDPLFWLAMGNVYFISSQLNESSVCYNRAMLLDKNIMEAWINYGAVLELDPTIGDPLEFYQKAYDEGNLPIKKEVLKRKKLISELNNSASIPRIMEPNDRYLFRSIVDDAISIYLNERPGFDLNQIENPELLVIESKRKERPLKISEPDPSSSYISESEEDEEDENQDDADKTQ